MSITENEAAPKRIRWKTGKEQELWNYVQGKIAAGANISEALKAFAESNSISWLTARWKYYRLKQGKTGSVERVLATGPAPESAPKAVKTVPQAPDAGADETLGALSAFLKAATQVEGLDLTGLLNGLSVLTSSAILSQALRKDAEEVRRRNDNLAAEIESLRERSGKIKSIYGSLSGMVTEWLRLPGVNRVTALEEFGRNLSSALTEMGRALGV